MDEPGFTKTKLSDCRVAIWGLGLMGGSLAMALRGKCARLVAIDRDSATVALAKALAVVDEAVTDAREGLAEADLIILATPVRTILAMLEALPDLMPGKAIVMDLGSTKARIIEAMRGLPERFDPLGAHPMCGKETAGLRSADGGIYQHAPFALVALERTSPRARVLAEELAREARACPLWIDAAEHDRWVAATSHTPFLLAAALAQATPGAAAPLVGPGFRGAARLAATAPEMMVDILATNTGSVRAALARVREQLSLYDALLEAGDYETLAEQFRAAADHLQKLSQTA